MTPEDHKNAAEHGIDIEVGIRPGQLKKGDDTFILTDQNRKIKSFPYNDHGAPILIPEPDPIKVFFDTSYHNFRHIKTKRQELIDQFKGKTQDENYAIALYAYYGSVNNFIILLFTSIEAFINYNIRDNYKYAAETKTKTTLYNKFQIMDLDFMTKIDKVLPDLFGRNFQKSHNDDYVHIKNLKEFRDSIVHLKPDAADSKTFAVMFKRGLNFRFEETIDSVMAFMNFYVPGTLEYCPCSQDF
jgi:hypothetical protein